MTVLADNGRNILCGHVSEGNQNITLSYYLYRFLRCNVPFLLMLDANILPR